MAIKVVYKYSSMRIRFEIKVGEVNGKISSGATYTDGFQYCGFPAENLNYFETEEEAIIYQCNFFIEMFNKIIAENEVKSNVRAVKNCRGHLISYKFKGDRTKLVEKII